MIEQHFEKQIEMNPEKQMYFYALERPGENPDFPDLEIHTHKGSLDEFPTDLEYIRTSLDTPVFKKVQ
jgi:hypothetical protein